MPVVQISCQVCGLIFRCQASNPKKTCSRHCFRTLMSRMHARRIFDDDTLKCENELDPVEHQRRIDVVRHNSMVNSGVLSAPLIPMDWLDQDGQSGTVVRRRRYRKDKKS